MNRHADSLDDFFQAVQAALNRNGHKPDLDTLSWSQIIKKLNEENRELILEINHANPNYFHLYPLDPQKVEREAADLAVCALAAFIWARRRDA